ncbi:MAG: DUF2807 domain-containing protein [Bacteroidales bacterium]|nr:DUF2807 domain-containing protein [Bacteroidales bacterium]
MKQNIRIRSVFYSPLMLILFVFGAFSYPVISGSQEVRNIDDFNCISLSIAAKVYILQGNECRLEIEASDDDLGIIETKVKDGKLEIKTRSWSANLSNNVTIHITIPELKGLSVAGSGNIIADSDFKCQDLDLSVTGSGAIKMADLTVQAIKALITGSGKIMLNGKKAADELSLTITGSGSYSAEEMQVNDAKVTITGSGSARINVAEELKTNITGSGNVHYKGDPMVDANATGSGKTKKM